jgi:hypothetical protein
MIFTEAVSTMPTTIQYQKHLFFNVLGKPPGYDRVRNAEIGNKDFELDVMEEAYTTEHWIVRIYKVKDLPNRGVR